MILPGQADKDAEHCFVSSVPPTQPAPLLVGVGDEQLLFLISTPVPQVTLQSPHELHAAQFPRTKINTT